MDKQLPHNINSERIVLGSIMSHVNALSEISPILTSEMFYNPFHQEIYNNITELAKKGKSVDLVIVSEKYLNDPKKLELLVDISGSFSPDYYDHALNIQEKFVRRKLWTIAKQLSSDVFSDKETVELLYNLHSELDKFNQEVSKSEISTIKDAIRGVYKQIETNLKGNALSGTDTGFSKLNKATGGLQKSDLIIVAGESSQGKSSLALSMVNTATQQGKAVAIYSMEMTSVQLAARLLSMNTGIPSNQILYTPLSDEYLEILDTTGLSKVNNLPIYFDDNSTSNIDRIIASIRSMKSKFDITGAVIDYLQILNVNQKSLNKEQAMGDVARRLKNLAKELNIWVIALSQLNRDMNNPIPTMNRLRDSGQIGEAADIVMFIYRPEVYGKFYPEPFASHSTEGSAMVDIAKGRNIGLLKFICSFDAKTTHFTELKEFVPVGAGKQNINDDDYVPF